MISIGGQVNRKTFKICVRQSNSKLRKGPHLLSNISISDNAMQETLFDESTLITDIQGRFSDLPCLRAVQLFIQAWQKKMCECDFPTKN
jgi:hypothetical protein